MRQGTRVMFLDHPQWRGGRLQGFEGEIVTAHYARAEPPKIDFYIVAVDWLVRFVHAVPSIICPVYNDCEVCGYAAWRAMNFGTEKQPDYHHFCAWH